VRNPATINRVRLAATTASLTASSSQTFILFLSIGFTEGSASCRPGRKGPLYTRDAEVDAITGILKAAAVRANATALLSTTCTGSDSTPKPEPRLKIDEQHRAFFWFQKRVFCRHESS
jgi:hypothetical protein